MCSLVGRDGYLVTANKLSPVYLVRHRPKALDQFKSLQAADEQCLTLFTEARDPHDLTVQLDTKLLKRT